jgi:hypothetical protein
MSPVASPSEADVLQAIADLLTEKRSSAAIAHYPTLRIQTNNLHSALVNAMERVEVILDSWSAKLAKNGEITPEFELQGTALFPYRTILPFLIRNLHQTADFLLEETRATPPVGIDQIGDTVPSFSDFVKLGGAVRGFLDALVQAAYQLATFDGRQLNYKFLQSLLSFATVAPPALHTNIVSPEMQVALDAYVALPNKDKKNSAFTKAAHDQFPQRLQVASRLAALPDWRRRNLELLFSFCSDFVHSGYISVLAIGYPGADAILGGADDAFTPKAENFAELKQRLLAECAGAYADLLVSMLRHAIGRTLLGGMPSDWKDDVESMITGIGDVRAILHRQLVEPVREGLIASGAIVRIHCMCGCQVDLSPPHHEWDRFCPTCGSRFVLHEVPNEVDYVVSQAGIGDVLGGDAPKISTLNAAARAKLDRIAARHAPKYEKDSVSFVLVTDLDRCNEDTLDVPSQVTSSPSCSNRKRCQLFTFISAKSVERCTTVRVNCNCGAAVDYGTATGTNVCQCSNCQRFIGLMGVSGDGYAVTTQNPDGTPGLAPIQARNRFKVPGIAVD